MLVAVTGASGFLAGYLLPELARRHRVAALTRSAYTSSALPGVQWRTNVDYGWPLDLFPPGTEAVINLAAALPRAQAPPEYYWPNVATSLRVLRGLAQVGGRRLIQASSQMVYGAQANRPVSENVACLAEHPYGVSKLAADAVLQEQGQRLGVEVICLRLAELIGLGQRWGFVCDRFMSSSLRGQDLELFGHYHQLRDLLYVKDAVRGIMLALENNAQGSFNIGAGCGQSLESYALACQRVLARGRITVHFRQPAGDLGCPPPDFWMSIDRARQTLGYLPSFTLDDALEDVLALAKKEGAVR